MPNLKVYTWEKERWPQYREIFLDRDEQRLTAKMLAERLDVPVPEITQSYKRGAGKGDAGSYVYRRGIIRLGRKTMLSTLVHEFAHHLNWMRGARRGHGKEFKACLSQCYAAIYERLRNEARKMKAQGQGSPLTPR